MDKINKDEIVDFMQTVHSMWRIEKGEHPTIKKDSEKYKEFYDWALETYYDKIDNYIKEINK